MLVLGIDTSTRTAGIALAEKNGVLAEISLLGYMTQLRDLVPNIAWMLDRLDTDIKSVDLIAIGQGPGSFTGLRVGMATGKALAQALGCPAVGVPTLDILAYGVLGSSPLICPMIDARHDRIYASLYSCTPSPQALPVVEGTLYRCMPFEAPRLETLAHTLEATEGEITLVGDGAAVHAAFLKKRLGKRLLMAPEEANWPRPSIVARLGMLFPERLTGRDLQPLAPLYIRASSAEREAGAVE